MFFFVNSFCDKIFSCFNLTFTLKRRQRELNYYDFLNYANLYMTTKLLLLCTAFGFTRNVTGIYLLTFLKIFKVRVPRLRRTIKLVRNNPQEMPLLKLLRLPFLLGIVREKNSFSNCPVLLNFAEAVMSVSIGVLFVRMKFCKL